MKIIKNLLIGGVLSLSVFLVACGDDDTANQSPQAQNVTLTVAEDVAVGTLVGTISATDPEEDALTFTITSGNDANAFDISNAGAITTLTALDFETTASYTLTVTISDGTNSIEVTASITVTDVAEGTGGSGNEGVDLTIDGVTYTLLDGIVADYGGDGTHYNYDFTLIDDEIALDGGELVPGEETTIGVYVELFSAGNSSFTPGTFDYLNESTNPGAEQSYFNIFEIYTFDEPIGANSEPVPDGYFIGVSGTVTVTENANLDYTITYNVNVAEADWDTEEFIDGGSEFTVEFTFSGTFEFEPLEGAAGRIGADKKKLIFN